MIRLLLAPLRLVLRLSRWVMLVLLLATAGLNLALLTLPKVFDAASTLLERARVSTIQQRHATALRAERAAKRAAEGELRRMKGTNATLQRRADGLRTQNATLARQVSDLDAKRRVTLGGKTMLVGQAVRQTSDAVSLRTSRAVARNIATMPGEALPFVGMAVVAAATAYEVKEACDTLADLKALELALSPGEPPAAGRACGGAVPGPAELIASLRAGSAATLAQMEELYGELPAVPWRWNRGSDQAVR